MARAEPAPAPSRDRATPDPQSDDFGAALVALTGTLRRRARQLTRDATEAEDLVQDTLMRAWSARSSFQPGTNLRAWAFTILRNRHLSRIRRARRVVELAERDAENLVAVGADQHEQAALQEVIRAIDHLPTDQRLALCAVALDGLDYESAAYRLDVSLAALKSRVRRARAALVALVEGTAARHIVQAFAAAPVDPTPVPSATLRLRSAWAMAKIARQPLWIG